GPLGVVAVDVHVPPLDAQLAALHVLAHRGQGLLGPLGAVGALVVGEDDEHHGGVDGALGEQVVLVAGLLLAEVGDGDGGGVLDRPGVLRLGAVGRRISDVGGVGGGGGFGAVPAGSQPEHRGDQRGGDDEDQQRDHPAPAGGAR